MSGNGSVNSCAPFGRVSIALWVGLACIAAFMPACGDSVNGVKLVPVVGHVRVDGRPLITGTLSFLPDPTKGNAGTLAPGGEIKADGTYTLFSSGRQGAPVGWYKVVVIAADPVDPNKPYAPRRSYVNSQYNTVETTDLLVEVAEKPASGAYDLDLKK